uniref:Uncharacterized protein n=1 Tax=Rhipicephalus zambeziensis TaxID=60191 RepID=A0A224YEK6_9ACAR
MAAHNHTLRARGSCYERPLRDRKQCLSRSSSEENISSTSILHRSLLGLLFGDLAEIKIFRMRKINMNGALEQRTCIVAFTCASRLCGEVLFFFFSNNRTVAQTVDLAHPVRRQ